MVPVCSAIYSNISHYYKFVSIAKTCQARFFEKFSAVVYYSLVFCALDTWREIVRYYETLIDPPQVLEPFEMEEEAEDFNTSL